MLEKENENTDKQKRVTRRRFRSDVYRQAYDAHTIWTRFKNDYYYDFIKKKNIFPGETYAISSRV